MEDWPAALDEHDKRKDKDDEDASDENSTGKGRPLFKKPRYMTR